MKKIISWLKSLYDKIFKRSSSDSPEKGNGKDDIDLRKVTFDHHNVSDWPITSTLKVSAWLPNITLSYDKANVWPAVKDVNANPWIIANISGKWRAATWEWLRKNQVTKGFGGKTFGSHIKKSAWPGDWMPQKGETVYLMVSGLARDATRNVKERTQAVKFVVP